VAGTLITQTQTLTNPDGTFSQQVVTLTQVITVPDPLASDQVLQYMQVYSGGLAIISNTTSITPGVGYTETHSLKFIAYDAAGNKTETQPTTFSVIHDPEALEEEKPQAALWPARRVVPLPGMRSWGARQEPTAWRPPLAYLSGEQRVTAGGKGPPG
jgi:hypothetical protein